VFDLKAVEETCDSQEITLVIHPAVRQAVEGYAESLYIGLRCFLAGDSDGLYFLPLQNGGYERLVFSKRISSGGHTLLRVNPAATESLVRIKASISDVHQKA
jgi:hypothetical protein